MAVIKLFHALISCQSYKSRARHTLLNLLIFHSLLPIQRFMTSCLTRNQTTFKLIYFVPVMQRLARNSSHPNFQGIFVIIVRNCYFTIVFFPTFFVVHFCSFFAHNDHHVFFLCACFGVIKLCVILLDDYGFQKGTLSYLKRARKWGY